MNTLLTWSLWIAALLVVYHHLGYPLLLRWEGRAPLPLPEPRARGYRNRGGDEALPTVTLVMPVYNEAPLMEAKLYNLICLDYPPGRLKVMIHFDGCSDESVAVTRTLLTRPEFAQLAVTLWVHEHNRGKVAVLNEALTRCDSELICLTDLSALLPVDALLLMVAHFRDRHVGVVGGGYRFWQVGSVGEEQYWRYQSNIKHAEASRGEMLGAHGACYMLRRAAVTRLPADTINDDFMLPCLALLKGYHARYERRVPALELEISTPELEASRRQRIGAGNVQQLLRLLPLLHPRHGWTALNFASGKGLRVLMPWCLLFIWGASLVLAQDHPLYLVLALLQTLGYGTVALLHWTRVPLPGKWASLHYLVLGHWYNGLGAVRYLLHRPLKWKKTESPS